MSENNIINTLGDVLQMAYDHLEYCGYGDSWERECADSQMLSTRIESALELFEKYKQEN